MEISVYESNGDGQKIARVYFGRAPRFVKTWKSVYSAALETENNVLALGENLIEFVGSKRLNYRDFTPNFSDAKKGDLGIGFSGIAAEELSGLVKKTFNL
ncbi:hypothetical protein HY449_02805 [Candidatus Pacearchaeota archaeon]|nr:hypothetical protein [Candidatus Pacearchaeota archaeon]